MLEAGCGCLGGRGAMGRARWGAGVYNGCIEVIPHPPIWLHLDNDGPEPPSAVATSTLQPS